MSFTNLELLRLHIEAVWNVHLPTITASDTELLPDSSQPEWLVYNAQTAEGHFLIWQPGIDSATRSKLRDLISGQPKLSKQGQSLPQKDDNCHKTPVISREVALQQIARPEMAIEDARLLARRITQEDYDLVEAFQPGEAASFFLDSCRPLFGVIESEHLFSLAHSSRRTATACELGIDTLPEARRKGYALASTLLWAEAIMQEGLIPFYSAMAENTASLKLAHKAGYRAFAYGTYISI